MTRCGAPSSAPRPKCSNRRVPSSLKSSGMSMRHREGEIASGISGRNNSHLPPRWGPQAESLADRRRRPARPPTGRRGHPQAPVAPARPVGQFRHLGRPRRHGAPHRHQFATLLPLAAGNRAPAGSAPDRSGSGQGVKPACPTAAPAPTQGQTMPNFRRRRSCLTVPGGSEKMLAKADRAFSSEVATGSREENAAKPSVGASILILSERKL